MNKTPLSDASNRQRAQDGPRIRREKTTIKHMIHIYCKRLHRDLRTDGGLCPECLKLENYAMKRLTFCQFGEEKTTCVDCPVHCYAPKQRDSIKRVMRYSGPRMLWVHPVLTIRHLLDGRTPKNTPN